MKSIEELRKLTKDELYEMKRSDVAELRKGKFELKSGNVAGEVVNRVRELKKEIARISTVLNEMNLLETVENNEKAE